MSPPVIYEYRTVNITLEPNPVGERDRFRKPTIESAANRWAEMGWRTVAVMPSPGVGYADCILVERVKGTGSDDDG